jgi:hypothetical protein
VKKRVSSSIAGAAALMAVVAAPVEFLGCDRSRCWGVRSMDDRHK